MILLWVVTWSCPLPDSHMVIKLCHASLILLYIDLTVEIMLWLSQRFCHECVRLNKLVWCNIFIPVCLIFGAVWYHCSEWLTVWFSTVTHHPFSLPFSLSLFLSGRVLSGFWFEFSRSHCCGRGSQLPNRPCAYLLSDWPKEESHWLPVCITTKLLASCLNSPLLVIYLLLPFGFLFSLQTVGLSLPASSYSYSF